jgi:RNA-directed DNA polymerase
MGNSDSINFNLSSLYTSWYNFRRAKRASSEIMSFQYYLESNIDQLHHLLSSKTYKHGSYAQFTVQDSKKREIAVAPVRDRVIHRLIYDYLTPIWDKSFIFDAWSCRVNKGQHKAIERAALYMQRYQNGWVWRADIMKFFDSIDQEVLFQLIKRRTTCPDAQWLIHEVLWSYSKNEIGRGMPIGNLTSQIFANIYLNELDRYMVHVLKPAVYLRYGDDWLCFTENRAELLAIRKSATKFLSEVLKLNLSQKLDIIKPVAKGVTYLGIDLWPGNQRITKATRVRIDKKITSSNYYSYEAFIRHFSNKQSVKKFYWRTLDT